MFIEEDTRPRITLKNLTYNEECVVIVDEVGLVIGHGDTSWCLTWEKLEEMKEKQDGREAQRT